MCRYHELLPEVLESARFDFLRLLPPSLPSLPPLLTLLLLRLLSSLGPSRLSWLPPDPQAWASGSAPAPVPLTHLLRLLVSTPHAPLHDVAVSLVTAIADAADAPGAHLVSALLSVGEGGCGVAEFALRLVANQPHAFSLLALRAALASDNGASPLSPLLPALLFLTGGKPEEEEGGEDELRAELQGFGLPFDRLRGRFADSAPALALTTHLLQAVVDDVSSPPATADVLRALAARLGAGHVVSKVLQGEGQGKEGKKDKALAKSVKKLLHEGKALAAVELLEQAGPRQDVAVLGEVVTHILGQGKSRQQEETRRLVRLLRRCGPSLTLELDPTPLSLLPAVYLKDVLAQASGKEKEEASEALLLAVRRAPTMSDLLALKGPTAGMGGHVGVAMLWRAWQLDGSQGIASIVKALLQHKGGEGKEEQDEDDYVRLACVLRTFLPALLMPPTMATRGGPRQDRGKAQASAMQHWVKTHLLKHTHEYVPPRLGSTHTLGPTSEESFVMLMPPFVVLWWQWRRCGPVCVARAVWRAAEPCAGYEGLWGTATGRAALHCHIQRHGPAVGPGGGGAAAVDGRGRGRGVAGRPGSGPVPAQGLAEPHSPGGNGLAPPGGTPGAARAARAGGRGREGAGARVSAGGGVVLVGHCRGIGRGNGRGRGGGGGGSAAAGALPCVRRVLPPGRSTTPPPHGH